MTIATELTKLQTNLANSYTAVDNKGGTLPASENFDNLATAIDSIPTGGGGTQIWGATIEDIFPNTNYNNTTSTGHEIVMEVTASNMTNNGTNYRYAQLFLNSGIKKFTMNSTNANQQYWMWGICQNAKFLEEFSCPEMTQITGNYALENACRMAGGINVNGIKKISFPKLTNATGQYCLRYGFTGGTGSATQDCEIDLTKVQSAGQYAFYQLLSNSPGYIHSPNSDAFEMNQLTSVGNYSCSYMCSSGPSYRGPKKIHMDGLVNAYGSAAFNAFCNYLVSLEELSFASLTTISSVSCFNGACASCLNLKKVNFKKLKTMGGNNAMNSMFNSCSSMPATYCFESLETIGTGNAIMGRFVYGTCSIKNLFLPSCKLMNSATTNATGALFYDNRFEKIYLPNLVTCTGNGRSNIFSSCTLTEFHFGKENQATIEAMDGYSSLWGRGAGSATVYFDLINHITVGGVVYDRDGPDYEIDYDGGTSYYSWKDSSDNIVYTTNPYTPAVNDSVYTKSGDTYTVSGTITAVA